MTAAERETGNEIISAAAELFAQRGYKGTTTRAIAEKAGVNEVTIFRRFKNKQGILRALGESWQANMAGYAVGVLPEPEDTRATLEALARLEVAQATLHGAVTMRLAMEATMSPEIAEWMGEGSGDNFTGLVVYLTERQAAGDLRQDLAPQVMAEAFFALTSTLVLSRQVLGRAEVPGDLSADEFDCQLLDLYMTGIGLKQGVR